MFITLEGGEGCGKTTQAKRLADYFSRQGKEVIHTREPGGTQGAEEIRELLVTGDKNRWDPETELLLFNAARLNHVNILVKPALAAGKVVICDRGALSTCVYQCFVKGVPVEKAISLDRNFIRCKPDLILYFDLDPKIGLNRANAVSGHENRFESEGLKFHRMVREGFAHMMKHNHFKDNSTTIDASGDLDDVTKKMIEKIEKI